MKNEQLNPIERFRNRLLKVFIPSRNKKDQIQPKQIVEPVEVKTNGHLTTPERKATLAVKTKPATSRPKPIFTDRTQPGIAERTIIERSNQSKDKIIITPEQKQALKERVQTKITKTILSHLAAQNRRRLTSDPLELVLINMPESIPLKAITGSEPTQQQVKEFILTSIFATLKRMQGKGGNYSVEERQIVQALQQIKVKGEIDFTGIIFAVSRHFSIPIPENINLFLVKTRDTKS